MVLLCLWVCLLFLTFSDAQTVEVTFTVYASQSGSCLGAGGTTTGSFTVGQCSSTAVGIVKPSAISSTSITLSKYDPRDAQCTGSVISTLTMVNGQCFSNVPGGDLRPTWTGGGGGSSPCFHENTIITYAGKEYTLDEIRVHPECSIPHVVRAHGVIVSAKCGATTEKTLKLTDGHLVYTQRGLQAAGDLKPGHDTVYADLDETAKCQVVSVTKETQQHDYFGLNCLNSQVLASGLKASTFEKLHSVPAFWMQIMGRILGIKRASKMGDYVAELVQGMNLI